VWWDHSEPLEVYLSDNAVGRGTTSAAAAYWVETSGLDDSLQHVAAWLDAAAAPKVRRIRVWLSASLAWPYLVPATSGARNKREVQALATAMAHDATGIDGEVRLWLDRWRVGEPALAVAMPATVWQGLHDIVRTRNALRTTRSRKERMPAIAIVSMRPWWNLPFDGLLAESRSEANRVGWSLSDGAGILHGVVDRGSVAEIGLDRPSPHDPSGDLLRRRLQVNWGAVSARHLHFERHASGVGASPLPIGAWRDVSGGGA
jgi:hypothetical protein